MSVVVVATIYPQQGSLEEVVGAYVDAAEEIHAEAGCELYALHSGEDRLVVVEKWASPAALGAHATSELMLGLRDLVGDKLAAATDVQVLEARPAGESRQGAL
jgi:quinol monooxygenase YgiN